MQDTKGQSRLVDALNEVCIIGNLTRDAELRYTTSGAAVTRSSVAVNERHKDGKGQWQDKTHYVDVNVWRDLAEGTGELKKDDAVFVTGRLVNDSWTDNDGNKRYATRVEGARVEFLVGGKPAPVAVGAAAGGAAKTATAGGATAAHAPVSQLDLDEEYPVEEDLPF